MFLKHVEQHTHVGNVVHIFQLVRRKLINDNRLIVNLIDDVEARNSDVARQNGLAS